MALSIVWAGSPANQLEYALAADGSGQTTLSSTGITAPRGLAVDGTNEVVYWSDNTDDTVIKIGFDGTGQTTILTSGGAGIDVCQNLAVDETNSKLYFSDKDGVDFRLRKCDLDGSNVEGVFAAGLNNVQSFALDVAAAKIYYEDNGTEIHVADIADGGNDATLFNNATDGLSLVQDIALDIPNSHIYMVDQTTKKVQRGDFDGVAALTDLSAEDGAPHGIALDLTGSRMYILSSLGQTIRGMDLDGSNDGTIFAGDLLLMSTVRLMDIGGATGRKTFWGPWFHLAGPGGSFGQSLPK